MHTVGKHQVRKARVLAIDDDESMRGLIKLHLQNAGYEVLLAEDAIAGGRLAMTASPDLVITDVLMPFMDGYELVEALRADPGTRNIPIVFLTTDDNVEERSGPLGVQACLRKPVSLDQLLEVVARFAVVRA